MHGPFCRHRGATLLEIVMAFSVLAAIASVGVVAANSVIGGLDANSARTNLRSVAAVISNYAAERSSMPSDSSALASLVDGVDVVAAATTPDSSEVSYLVNSSGDAATATVSAVADGRCWWVTMSTADTFSYERFSYPSSNCSASAVVSYAGVSW